VCGTWMKGHFEKEIAKNDHETHVITVPKIKETLIDGMVELKKIEILER
jgi:hypothetical protein